METIDILRRANSWDVELEIVRGDDAEELSFRFGGDLAMEVQNLAAKGFSATIGSSQGARIPSTLIEFEFKKAGETTVTYNLLFVRHYSGALVRVNTLREAVGYVFPPSEAEVTTH